jgi:hypothetical protein
VSLMSHSADLRAGLPPLLPARTFEESQSRSRPRTLSAIAYEFSEEVDIRVSESSFGQSELPCRVSFFGLSIRRKRLNPRLIPFGIPSPFT